MSASGGGAERPYAPIACGVHDELLALATLKRPCDLAYRDNAGAAVAVRGRITDVFSRGSEEFLTLEGGPTIRLDKILSIDGKDFAGGGGAAEAQ